MDPNATVLNTCFLIFENFKKLTECLTSRESYKNYGFTVHGSFSFHVVFNFVGNSTLFHVEQAILQPHKDNV
jgi:hypothetical protein